MTRLFVALAIAILAPMMAISLVRDARSRKPAEPNAPVSAAAASHVSAPRPPASAAGPETRADPPRPAPAEHPLSEALCFSDMVFIDALACTAVRDGCADADGGSECAASVEAQRCSGAERRLSFCIDRFEYPNVPGTRPAMLLTFEMAEGACHHERKRLCTDEEWTLACEGTTHALFAHGNARVAAGCNTGPAAARIPVEKLWNAKELHRWVEQFDGRLPSGSRPGCMSTFGVGDLTGNVAEWVHVSAGDPSAALKGGDFTGPPTTCRAVRRIAASHYAAFAVGTRCCADPLVPLPRRR